MSFFPPPWICSSQIKQTQDEEKKQLTALRDLIKSSLQLDQKEVGQVTLRCTGPNSNSLNIILKEARPN